MILTQQRPRLKAIVPEQIYIPVSWTLPVSEGPVCTVCHGEKEIPKTGGGTIACPNCGGSGEERGDPRDVVMLPSLGSGHEVITCGTCGSSICPTCDASSHGAGKCG